MLNNRTGEKILMFNKVLQKWYIMFLIKYKSTTSKIIIKNNGLETHGFKNSSLM